VQPGIIGSTTANIYFGPGVGPARDYTVELHRIQQGIGSTLISRFTVTQSPLLLTGLLPSTLYGVTFYANCLNGTSSGATGGAGIPFTTLPALSASTRRPAALFSVYPNPAQTSITLQLPSAAPRTGLHLLLLDATGRIIHTQPASFNATGILTLPVPSQPAGWYLLRLQGPDGYQANQPLVLQ
jgi:hypothetical protein